MVINCEIQNQDIDEQKVDELKKAEDFQRFKEVVDIQGYKDGGIWSFGFTSAVQEGFTVQLSILCVSYLQVMYSNITGQE